MSLTDKADALLRVEAIDNLTQRLTSGQKVGTCDLHDLLDNELQTERYAIVHSELAALLLCETNEGAEKIRAQIRDGLIERYLLKPDQEWLIEEEMAQIEFDSGAYLEDAEEVGMA